MHCSLPFRQLSELSYLLQYFNLFICHLASLPISNFGKLLRKTSAICNYFGKLRKTTSVKYIDENSSGRNLGTKTPQTEASGKCSSIFLLLLSPSNKAGWAYHSKLLGDKRKQNNRTCCRLLSANSCVSVKLLLLIPLSETNWNNSNIEQRTLCDVRIISVFVYIIQPRVIFIRKVAISKTLYSLVHQPSFRAKMILKNTFTFTGTLSRGFGLRSFRPKLTNLNILRIGKSVFVSVFVFVEWAFTVNLRPKKTPQAEISGVISGRKLLRPKPLESVPPQFFLPLPPSPSNKAGWAYRSKLLRDIVYSTITMQSYLYRHVACLPCHKYCLNQWSGEKQLTVV